MWLLHTPNLVPEQECKDCIITGVNFLSVFLREMHRTQPSILLRRIYASNVAGTY
jgi:hypothetical protein